MKSNKKRGSKGGAIAALCVVLVLTLVAGYLGLAGFSIPPKGLYKLLPWLPTTDADRWPASLPLGLDLRGGMFVEYSAESDGSDGSTFANQLQGTISIIQQRLTDKGWSESTVQQLGSDGIRVEVPNVQEDTDAVLDLIGAAAELSFVAPDGTTLDGKMVQSAQYAYDQGDHQVAFKLTSEGTELFASMTSKNIGRQISIYLDGELLISPTVQSAITNGEGVINGMGSVERATSIAAKIQSGALPLKLTQQKVDKVSATLGKDALSTSVLAAVIGIALVMLLMILRYRLNGLVASWALTIYVIVLFLLIALFGIQLTLPGLAGVVLGIGMAVDANVIIFERFNEEVRAGKAVKTAVRTGFKNAMSAILDSNITTLIAAIVLLIFGTASIQGFAKTLLLGVVVSMFSAILVTRFLMNRFVNAGAVNPGLYTKVKAEKEEVAQ